MNISNGDEEAVLLAPRVTLKNIKCGLDCCPKKETAIGRVL